MSANRGISPWSGGLNNIEMMILNNILVSVEINDKQNKPSRI